MGLTPSNRRGERPGAEQSSERLPDSSWRCGSDPLGFYAGDTNLYRYVGDDPVNETGPSGLRALKLGIVTTPTNDFSNPIEFKIRWIVPEGQSGWIIQEVEFAEEEFIRTFRGEIVKETLWVHPKGFKYWEAWRVINGKVYATRMDPKKEKPYLLFLNPTDTFTVPQLDTRQCKKGNRTITGNAVFLKDYALDIRGGGWGFDVLEAGLLSTRTSPEGWDALSRDATYHFLEVIYDNLNRSVDDRHRATEPPKGTVRWFPYNTDPNWRIPVEIIRIKE